MSELQQNRYDQLIRRVGGLIGPGSKVSDAISELFPMLEVENTTPELLALSGWRLAWNASEVLASVGDASGAQIFNPLGSGSLVAVTALMVRSTSDSTVTIGVTDTQLGGTPIRGRFRDSRFGGARETVATTEGVAPAVASGGLFLRVVGRAELVLRDDNGLVVLAPGSGLSIVLGTVNNQLTVNFFWRERAAEASELSF